METQIIELEGSWDLGYALHKHTLSSVCIGYNEGGYPKFDTTRSEPGEALYQLKYKNDWNQVAPLAAEVRIHLLPLFRKVGLIIPMPASTSRKRQPVNELAQELGQITNIPVFDDIIRKKEQNSTQLKNLNTYEEKIAALQDKFILRKSITNDGRWNALLLDDLFHTGATMEVACTTLRTYEKIKHIYVATITRRQL